MSHFPLSKTINTVALTRTFQCYKTVNHKSSKVIKTKVTSKGR